MLSQRRGPGRMRANFGRISASRAPSYDASILTIIGFEKLFFPIA
jgi:hypothetical protein